LGGEGVELGGTVEVALGHKTAGTWQPPSRVVLASAILDSSIADWGAFKGKAD